MRASAPDPAALLAGLRRAPAGPRVPPPPGPRAPPPGGGCGPGRAVPPGGAGGRSPRPAPGAAEREAGGRPGAKALLITLPDIGEEAAAESEGAETACGPRRPA